MTHYWFTPASLMILLITLANVSVGEEVTIMAVGDSITQGGKSFHCYREFLIPMLSNGENDVRFVGPNQDQFSAHCGFGGKDTEFLNSIIKDVYATYPADIVLIHSGHNSFSKDNPVPKIVEATEQMIETIHALNPDVTILLAQVIPSGKLPKYSYIPELNRELTNSADRMKTKGIKIVLVDQANGFDWKLDTIEDKVHPNQSGARKMAEEWAQALKPVLRRLKESQ